MEKNAHHLTKAHVAGMHENIDMACDLKPKKRRIKHKWKFLQNKRADVPARSGLSFSLQLSKADSKEATAESEDDHNSLYIETDSDEIPKVLDAMEEEIERQLEEKAQKTNLTVANVKNMLKAVITNRDVMHMVNYSLQRSSEKPDFAPKLTRARTKELMEKEAIPLCQIPLTKKKSEFVELIAQDLLEDSSDEEYKPHVEWSEEESKASGNTSIGNLVPKEILVPKNENVCLMTSAENIGQRTRSKLCLSETPLETIEQAFIPPDITTDMYNTECDNQDWANFLKEFMQPLDNNLNETMDDENDPEYNVMADEEHERPDIEELRVDRAVKVSKKELNDLMSELFEFTNMVSSDDEDCQKKDTLKYQINKLPKETILPNSLICDKSIVSESWETKTSDYNLIKSKVNVDKFECVTREQYLLICQQMRQHVQLLTQNFLLTYGNPFSDSYAKIFKQLLVTLQYLGNRGTSLFNVANLKHSLNVINAWERLVNSPYEGEDIKRFIIQEENIVKLNKNKRKVYLPRLPNQLMQLCMESQAFLYPLMLPSNGFRSESIGPTSFTHSENMLVAIGLEEFTMYFQKNISTCSWTLYDLATHIIEYLIPTRTVNALVQHIKKMKGKNSYNPIKFYYNEKKAPEINHFIIPISDSNPRKLCHQPRELLPIVWANFNKV